MKKIAILGLAAIAFLSGCVAVPYDAGRPAYRGDGQHRGPGYYGDRDRDGVPNGYDRRPANPYRY